MNKSNVEAVLLTYPNASKFIKFSLMELNINNPPMNKIHKFHLSFNKLDFVWKKEIKIEKINNMPLIGSAVDRKSVND